MKRRLNTSENQKGENPLKPYLVVFAGVIIFKLIILVLFSSDYQNKLFMPFVEHFLINFDNPWQHFYKTQVDKFPYPPLMLYILSVSYLPYVLFFKTGVILSNLFFKFPTLISDICICWVLVKIFPGKLKEILLFYFLSPIIIFGAYIHSQLDMIPMAILMLSLYFLHSKRPLISSVVFGLALCAKFHIVAVLPLILIYLAKNKRIKDFLLFVLVPVVICLLVASPYLLTSGYYFMVLRNPKQMMLFDTFFSLGSLKIYIPIFVSLVIYARFLAYRKINDDLFYAFLGILFSLFVLFIFPAPAWYIWMAPFMSIFFIQYYSKYPPIIYLYFTLCLFYLVYFLFFHVSEYTPVILLNMSLPVRIDNEFARNILYTSLEMVLFAVLYSLYKFGVKSNSVYKKIHNFIIGIGGDSSAGKSTLLSDIKLILQDRALELEGDADHKWERSDENWQTITHLNPKANFLHRQAADLTALKYGRNVFRKDYDHGKGCFKSSNNIVPNEFIILSGLHTFYLPKTRKIIDLKIYLDTDERLRRHWKILRDARERGYSIGKINEQIEKRISDAKKFIEPQKGFADLIVSYEAKENFSVGDSFCAPSLKLKVTLDSSIHIESLIEKLMEENIEVLWDYVDDLNRQYILISNPPSKEVTAEIARDIIPNINEIINDGAIWQEGFRGFLQLVVLLVISEEMRAEGVSYET